LDKTNLVGILEDGTKIYGESRIDRRKVKPKIPIKSVYLSPKSHLFYDAKRAIVDADFIVFGPGDLYTSLIPTLLVEGMCEALIKTNAKIVYVINLMTKKGETDGFSASEFLRVFQQYLGSASHKLTHAIVNKKVNGGKKDIMSWYKKYGSIPVVDDLSTKKISDIKIVSGDFMDNVTFFRHSPEKLAKAIIKLL
jgi:uncharacterized cofD-like protein